MRAGGIDCEGRPGTVKGGHTHSVDVNVATILVTNGLVTFTNMVVSAINTLTFDCPNNIAVARVRSESIGILVAFPNIELRAADAVIAPPSFRVVETGLPVARVSFPIHPLYVMRTLDITITSPVTSPSIIARVRATAIFVHFNKINGTIHPTVQV
eukprot:Lithocolla_globosa_v1_NODE_3919_length_1550_cov_811.771237.p2 type:complete len:156 gc:universal NODE_3919_length_1550_cov_811.771237:569-1036(+)